MAAQPAPERGLDGRRPPPPSTPATRATSRRRRQEFISTATLAQFANTTAAPEVTKNAPPRAERAHYLDVGVTQQILPGLKVGLDAYYKQADYHLDEGQFGAPVFLTPFNYQPGYNYGRRAHHVPTPSAASPPTATWPPPSSWRKGIVSAQALFDADDLAYIHEHYIVTDHSQLITASAGALLPLAETRASASTSWRAAGCGAPSSHPNDSSNPPYQQLNLGIDPALHPARDRRRWRRASTSSTCSATNYVLRDGTGVGVFATQFGPPRGFFGGLKKEF